MKYKERNQIPSQNIKYERGVSKYYLENKYLHQQAMYSAILADRGYIKKSLSYLSLISCQISRM